VEPSYTVAPGDNLWSIARRHNVSVEALQAINSLPDQTTLRVGQRLVIP
jgi:membrane-bound lytic murein transglycosylase D